MSNNKLNDARIAKRKYETQVERAEKELITAKKYLASAESTIASIEAENEARFKLLPKLIGASLNTLAIAHEGYTPSQIRQWKAALGHVTSSRNNLSEDYAINDETVNLHAGSMQRLVKEGYFEEYVSSGFRSARDSHYFLITVKGVQFLIDHLEVPLTFKPD